MPSELASNAESHLAPPIPRSSKNTTPGTLRRRADNSGAHRTAGRKSTAAAKRATHRWARWLHVYTSMIALVLVLFFGITGITLNHPQWTFADATRTTTSGSLSVDPTLPDGSIDWLAIAERVRADYNVKGTVSDFAITGTEGRITFVDPGYSADLIFETSDASFDLAVEQQGFVAVMNDLHKGRDTDTAWRWVIDISAGFLVAVSLTGLTMQFFLRKRRRSGLISAVAGGLIAAVLIWTTVS